MPVDIPPTTSTSRYIDNTFEGDWSSGYLFGSGADALVEIVWGLPGSTRQEKVTGKRLFANQTLNLTAPRGLSIISVAFKDAVAGTHATVSGYFSESGSLGILSALGAVTAGASVNVQHAGALIGAEPTLNFVDLSSLATWTITDDAANTRVLITPPASVVKLAEVSLSGSSASISFTAIPSTFRSLRIVASLRTDRGATGDVAAIRFNADAGANYWQELIETVGATSTPVQETAQTSIGATGAAPLIPAGGAVAGRFGSLDLLIPNYAIASGIVAGTWQNAVQLAVAAGNTYFNCGGFQYAGTAPISQILIFPLVGPNFVAGSIATLYGFA